MSLGIKSQASVKGPIFICIFLILFAFYLWHASAGEDCASLEECQKEIKKYTSKLEKTRQQINDVEKQIEGFLSSLRVTDLQIESLKRQLSNINNDLLLLEENLNNRKEALNKKINLRDGIVRDFYKYGRPSVLELLFLRFYGGLDGGISALQYKGGNRSEPIRSKTGYLNSIGKVSDGLLYSSQNIFALLDIFEDSVGKEAIKQIAYLNNEILDYEREKQEALELRASLEQTQRRLLTLKQDIEQKRKQAQQDLKDLEKKEDFYQEAIAQLTAKQQQILAQKSGEESGSVGDYEPPTAKLPEPKFSPAFVAISYGAYTHYKGMSQYGAKGRAQEGQSYKEILSFYYRAGTKKVEMPKINVAGVGKMEMQRYLYGIAEMPSDWPEEALKAQAVAARSYAYRYAKEGKTICTTQACQVFLKSKSQNPPAAWKKAVDDTKDIILDGSVIAYYSSTTGGYIEGIGWDTKGRWPNDAYEKLAGSPWFYKAWWTKSYNDPSTCGRSDPYLTEKEMADILNAVIVWQKGNSQDRDRISPITTSCWGGNPYSLAEMKEKAANLDKAFSRVESIDVDISNNGRVSQIKFGTDQGIFVVNGEVFKTVFNLRAPGYISIRNRLYEVVKK